MVEPKVIAWLVECEQQVEGTDADPQWEYHQVISFEQPPPQFMEYATPLVAYESYDDRQDRLLQVLKVETRRSNFLHARVGRLLEEIGDLHKKVQELEQQRVASDCVRHIQGTAINLLMANQESLRPPKTPTEELVRKSYVNTWS